jgi:hypothetical protein
VDNDGPMKKSARSDGDALVARAVAILGRAWGSAPPVGEVVVAFPHRAVFRSEGPDGDVVYVKVEAGDRRCRREALALRTAAEAGIEAPTLRHVVLGPVSVVAVGHVEGSVLTDHDVEGWRRTGALLARLHAVQPPEGMARFDHREPDWRSFLRWWTRHEIDLVVRQRMVELRTLDVLVSFTDAVLASMVEPRRVFLHGDCQPSHVLLGPGRGREPRLIDWGDASTGDPLWDLAVLTAHHPHRLEVLLEGYGSDPDPGRRAVEAYRAVRLLGSATWMAEHGYDPRRDLEAALALIARLGGGE